MIPITGPARIVALAVSLLAASVASAAPSAGDVEMFEQRIRPVLILNCYRCHSSEAGELASGLSLESREGMLRGGKRGPAIVPGKPEESLLLILLRNWNAKEREPDLVMPPERELGRKTIGDIEDWIRKGAPWPETEAVRLFASPETNRDWEALRQEHWAWKPVRRPPLPSVNDREWPETPVDNFLLEKLEEEGVTPSTRAERRTLVRRLYFDLVGLPPDPVEVEDFVEDSAPDAYSRLVDRLLASSRYGERWGRHWLDVARYTDGGRDFLGDELPGAFRYRDWVVGALNEDMPYDEFVRLQIAGDLLAPGKQDAAVGFLAIGPTYESDGGTPAGQALARAETLDDRMDTLGRGFLGLTVSCARCHDHKFDPIPTRDYYSLAGVFNNTAPVDIPAVPRDVVERYDAARKTVSDFKAELNAWKERHERKYAEPMYPAAPRYLRVALRYVQRQHRGERPDRAELARAAGLRPDILRHWTKYLTHKFPQYHFPPLRPFFDRTSDKRTELSDADIERFVSEFEAYLLPRLERRSQALARFDGAATGAAATGSARAPKPEIDKDTEKLASGILASLFSLEDSLEEFLSADEKRRLEELEVRYRALKAAVPPKYPVIHSLEDAGDADMRIAERGDFLKPGPLAPRRFLRILAGADPPRFDKGSGRLGLAHAVASAENPLTARVFVNRVWRHHFGKALVRTPSNFGLLGERPTHPELLDWLASELVRNDWSIKSLHRTILLSAAYQMSSRHDERKFALDGDNRLVWRMNPRRLDVEVWRDGLLAVSGQLDGTLGGEPTTQILESPRRTLYTAISRTGDLYDSDEFLELFDFPKAGVSSAKRTISTVPRQYLFMLNSPFMTAQAKLFASRLAREASRDEARIERAHALLYGRDPQPQETALALTFLKGSGSGAASDGDETLTAWERYAQVLLSANEFLYVR